MRLMNILVLQLLLLVMAKGLLKVDLKRINLLQDVFVPTCQDGSSSSSKNVEQIKSPCLINDIYYTMDMGVNDKIFKMKLDLGLPISWIKSVDCVRTLSGQNKSCNMGQFTQNLECDKTCTNTQKTFNIQIDDEQNIEGPLIQERVSLFTQDHDKETFVQSIKKFWSMNKKIDNKVVDQFEFVLVNKISNLGDDDFKADGSIGLGLPYQTKGQIQQSSQSIDEENFAGQTFSLLLNKDKDITSLYVDGYDQNQISSDLIWVKAQKPAKSKQYWRLPIKSITLDIYDDESQTGVKDEIFLSTNEIKKFSAVISLSTSFISLPIDFINSVIDSLNAKQMYDCKVDKDHLGAIFCSGLNSPKDLNRVTFSIIINDDTTLKIDPVLFVKSCRKVKKSGKFDCFLNLHSSLDDQIVLGEAFLRNFYTIFDITNRKIGFSYLNAALLEDQYEIIEDTPSYVKLFMYFCMFLAVGVIIFLIYVIKDYQKTSKYDKAGLSSNDDLSDPSEFQQDVQAGWRQRVEMELAQRRSKDGGQIQTLNDDETFDQIEKK